MLEKITRPINLGIAGLELLGLIGCGETIKTPPNYVMIPEATEISGYPLSTGESYAKSWGSIATVLKLDDNTVLAYVDENNGIPFKVAQAQAIIESEINDGDNEKVELTGEYESPTTFKIKSVRANGLEVKF
ncbi:MAG TPA: hypothetical protein VJJ23_02510 [Candidatus Nanoarchaeia archaeon]|nr:hypothetical protein [Candidatus Nanoarchaeia archaeon]